MTYEESQADPESFFVPYAWEVAYFASADLGWRAPAVAIFDAQVGLMMTCRIRSSALNHNDGTAVAIFDARVRSSDGVSR